MSNDQPRNDDQADEPTAAEYQRVDPSTLPSHPAGQQAAIEGMATAEGWTAAEVHRLTRSSAEREKFERIADELNQRRLTPTSRMGQFAAHMLSAIEDYEQEQRERVAEAGRQHSGTERPDPLSRAALVNLARDHRTASRADVPEERYDELVETIADTFTLTDVRIMRGAWTAITEAMPRIAYVARHSGKSPDEIAQATGYTSSRVAQFIRQERQRAAGTLVAVAVKQDAAAGGDPRATLARYEAALADVAEEHREIVEQYLATLRAAVQAQTPIRYSWRIDQLLDDGTWLDREVGDSDAAPADLARLATQLLTETGATTERVRIFLWEGDEGADADAVHTAERDPR
ncbi:hypothetical protein MHW47_10820 [Streptomyces sp. OfavH-34-F]|uniref:hypothetical protein n=1 Tax=Streptomyces sp. OfavH-34-F TaxID=2917760 RepID=UPI001EF1E983|nr:hypothetical protein [Streptomyces sp. OfavH-34-F]MCG7524926.1 hypothetical protein [Streptomyces sp. OfavH-34-F]